MKPSPIIDTLRAQAADTDLFRLALDQALAYMDTVTDRNVFPTPEAVSALEGFREPIPEAPCDPAETLKQLHALGSPGTVAQTGGRYYGFVNGGAVPGSLAAKWLADVWDQNAALYVISPTVSVLEELCETWIVDLLGLPTGTAAGFVGGSSTATLCGLAAGRNQLLKNLGWDAGTQGLFGAPELRVVLGEGAHSTVYKALSILGLGSGRIEQVPMDAQGRIREDLIPEPDERTLLILQAGNVNSGAFDAFEGICTKARKAGAWVHVDGAFGLWAAASPRFAEMTRGMALADSWSADAHKTLNAPYDCGIILCRNREALASALHMTGSYIVYSQQRDNMLYTPDMSRRGRAVELWATLKSLGRQGVAELVENLHEKAAYFAESLQAEGFRVLNQVAFNQVLVACGSSAETVETLKSVQASGEMWCGGATWEGQPVIRISVCSYRTDAEDIRRSVAALVQARKTAVENQGV